MSAPRELMGDTTPIRPVESAPYKLIKPAYPANPASAPAKKYPPSPKASAVQAPVSRTRVMPVRNPIAWLVASTAMAGNFLLNFPA